MSTIKLKSIFVGKITIMYPTKVLNFVKSDTLVLTTGQRLIAQNIAEDFAI